MVQKYENVTFFFSGREGKFWQFSKISKCDNFWTKSPRDLVDTALESWDIILSKFLQDKVEFDQTKWKNCHEWVIGRGMDWLHFTGNQLWCRFSTLSGRVPLFLVSNFKVLDLSFQTPCSKLLSDVSLKFLNSKRNLLIWSKFCYFLAWISLK